MHKVDLSPMYHCGSHSLCVRGCYITAVGIPLRFIRPSRRGCIYGRHYLVLVCCSPLIFKRTMLIMNVQVSVHMHKVDLSPMHHCGLHSLFFRGCYITAVDIPIRLIRPSRRGCIYGRHCLVPVVATAPCVGEYGQRPIHPLF